MDRFIQSVKYLKGERSKATGSCKQTIKPRRDFLPSYGTTIVKKIPPACVIVGRIDHKIANEGNGGLASLSTQKILPGGKKISPLRLTLIVTINTLWLDIDFSTI